MVCPRSPLGKITGDHWQQSFSPGRPQIPGSVFSAFTLVTFPFLSGCYSSMLYGAFRSTLPNTGFTPWPSLEKRRVNCPGPTPVDRVVALVNIKGSVCKNSALCEAPFLKLPVIDWWVIHNGQVTWFSWCLKHQLLFQWPGESFEHLFDTCGL